MSNLDEPFLHTSVDRLCWVNLEVIDGIGPSERSFVPIEMKTVTKDTTDRAAYDRIRHIPVGSRFISVNFVSDTFKKLVWNPNYRGQVLHHAVVFKANYVQTRFL